MKTKSAQKEIWDAAKLLASSVHFRLDGIQKDVEHKQSLDVEDLNAELTACIVEIRSVAAVLDEFQTDMIDMFQQVEKLRAMLSAWNGWNIC